jgi:thioredoxin-like negative regulator of GroEL
MQQDAVTNEDAKRKEYINLNMHRMNRVEKTYIPSAEIVAQAAALRHKIYWLVLTEHWCGDAAQTLPALHKIAEMSKGTIELKLVYRDQNAALMDAWLTNDTRSIPKLVQLDEHYNVTGIWGPRPTPAAKLVKQLRADAATAANYAEELHLWYAKDRQQTLESEARQLLLRANMGCANCM